MQVLIAAIADQDTTLTIESWRTDDLSIWQEKIIPAFEKANPGIKVTFSPTAPTEYNAALNAKLDASSYTAADVLAKLVTVDGAGSNLDADFLEGQHGSFYQNAGNLNAGSIPAARIANSTVTLAMMANIAAATILEPYC